MTSISTSQPPLSREAASPRSPGPSAHPPLTTCSTTGRSSVSRPTSHASKHRWSQQSTDSAHRQSQPSSNTLTMFPSSLPYSLVRDFAYPTADPMHYGPLPVPSGPPSGFTTPSSDHRLTSYPFPPSNQPMPWDSWGPDPLDRELDFPPVQFGDGPPYSEDEDLQSPVVAPRHRKHKSPSGAFTAATGASFLTEAKYDDERGYFVGTSGDGSERYYVNQGDEANGPGGEIITYPPQQARQNPSQHASHQLQSSSENDDRRTSDSHSPASSGYFDADESRFSRDYQFTITSPDEEFHGKAVALFDFERENENELPLMEGQIIWVSYRHGQGWLVAEDPKTQESGLVPEEYVRLLRDIEGGMNSLTGPTIDSLLSSNEADTPTQAEPCTQESQLPPAATISSNGYNQPVLSMFSTSSKDLNPYPTEQLHGRQAPPQVVHYHAHRGGSQGNTPTFLQHIDTGVLPRDGNDHTNKGDHETTPIQERQRPEEIEAKTLPLQRMSA